MESRQVHPSIRKRLVNSGWGAGNDVPGEGNRFSSSQRVGEPAGKPLHDVLGRFGDALHQADDAAAGVERLCEKHRQDRIEQFRRDVGEETGEREIRRASRQSGKQSSRHVDDYWI